MAVHDSVEAEEYFSRVVTSGVSECAARRLNDGSLLMHGFQEDEEATLPAIQAYHHPPLLTVPLHVRALTAFVMPLKLDGRANHVLVRI